MTRSVTPKTGIATAVEADKLGEDSILDGFSMSHSKDGVAGDAGSANTISKMASTAKASFRNRSQVHAKTAKDTQKRSQE